MKALWLDYQRSYRPLRALWRVLLLIVAVVLSIQTVRLLGLRSELATRQAALQQLNITPAPTVPQENVKPEELVAARGVLAKFALPWGDLLDAIEAVQVTNLSLLSIEPGVGEGKLVITGEAQDYLVVLNYVTSLREQKVLRSVHLVHHEIRSGTQRFPVMFSVSADWGGAGS
jgi:nitrate reductase NapAB chaperone NapD